METLLEEGRNYINNDKWKVYWIISGVLSLIIVLVIVIVTYSSSSKADAPEHLGCTGHDQCPASKACFQGSCKDACGRLCGHNTTCSVFHHLPACACKRGHTGNPFTGCVPLETNGGWPPLTGTKTFYLETSIQADWQGAFMHCLRNNSRLASIANNEEFEEVLQIVAREGRRNSEYWTSGSNSMLGEHFFWASTGEYLSPTSSMWVKNEPRYYDNKKHCVNLWEKESGGYGLNNADCKVSHSFLCEYYV